MSREIKFRIWDIESSKWADNGYIRARDGRVELYQYDSWEKAWTVCEQPKGKLAVEQFTGLRDKNNKDLYEGDIVNWCPEITTGGYNTHYFKVEYKEFSGNDKTISQFQFQIIDPTGDIRDWIQCCGLMPNANEIAGSHIEIIGNIHENSELLTVKKPVAVALKTPRIGCSWTDQKCERLGGHKYKKFLFGLLRCNTCVRCGDVKS